MFKSKDIDLSTLSNDDLTYIVGLSRGHTDLQISKWIDREGLINLDRLTPDDIKLASRFIRVYRSLTDICK